MDVSQPSPMHSALRSTARSTPFTNHPYPSTSAGQEVQTAEDEAKKAADAEVAETKKAAAAETSAAAEVKTAKAEAKKSADAEVAETKKAAPKGSKVKAAAEDEEKAAAESKAADAKVVETRKAAAAEVASATLPAKGIWVSTLLLGIDLLKLVW